MYGLAATPITTPDAAPPLPADSLRATLAFGQDVVSAAFTGMRTLPGAPAATDAFHRAQAGWNEPPEHAVAPVCLGGGPDGYLFIDLALAPGVITVTGDRRVREEVGAELVNRLGSAIRGGSARQVAVVVAGTPFPPELAVVEPIRVAAADRFDPRQLGSDIEVCFIVCPLHTAADAATISSLTRAAAPRIIPIVVDDVVAADWALYAHPAAEAD
jgi:hypothetical protein